MKNKLLIVFTLLVSLPDSQTDTTQYIKVHFLYGSKPARGYKKTEFKAFGGIHGGHVSIQVGYVDYGFEPTDRVHIFSHKHNRKSDYVSNIVSGEMRYDTTSKVVTFIIPVTGVQYQKLNEINERYCKTTPYDYAFFGMRCASTVQDVLGQIGVVRKRSRIYNVLTTFYPKKLRKRLFRQSEKNKYIVIKNTGRVSRRWERD